MSNYLRYNQGTNYTLYYNALEYFETIMSNHPSIAKVTTGELLEVDDREFSMYTLGNVNILSSTVSNSTTRHEIQLVIADKIKNKDNESNPITNEQTIPFFGVDDTIDILANTLAIINDLTSLYPSIIMTLNISPETKVGKIQNWDAEENIRGVDKTYKLVGKDGDTYEYSTQELKEVIKDSNLGVAANGVLYTQDKPGLIADILNDWFQKRVEFRKLEKKYGEAKDTEKYEFYAKRQLVQKILLNSMYGDR